MVSIFNSKHIHFNTGHDFDDEGFDQIKEARRLFEEGILTEAEFNKIKSDRLAEHLEPTDSLEENLEALASFNELKENGILTAPEFAHLKTKFLAPENYDFDHDTDEVLEAISTVHEYINTGVVNEQEFTNFKQALLADF